eukprot:Skav204822  [mRNA]  locus=scaffold3914:215925:222120:- [translate_table: standard]
MRIPRAVLILLLVSVVTVDAFVLAIDLGSQFFKAAIVAPGRPFEVVHNTHSKRKTPTAVSFQEAVRSFGDDAVSNAAKGVRKTPMAWSSSTYFAYDLGFHASGSLLFRTGQADYTVQEVTAHLLNFAKEPADSQFLKIEDPNAKPDSTTVARNWLKPPWKAVSETILTVASSATMLQRRALLDAAKIAGNCPELPRPQLIHETSAAALHRALDLSLGGAGSPATNTSEEIKANRSTVLFFNMGSRHVEASLIQCMLKLSFRKSCAFPMVAAALLDLRRPASWITKECASHFAKETVGALSGWLCTEVAECSSCKLDV